ncbi:MAG: 30S ribosomal protein S20 [Patescibacteria group bacterium]
MPRTKTATKELRKNVRRRKQNLTRAEQLRAAVKGIRALVKAGKNDEARTKLPGAMKTIDKMAKIGFVARNKANRLKSQLSRSLYRKK